MKYLIFIVCYLIGSIPFSYVIARIVTGQDIRRVGSGNVGASNVMRTTGKAPGLIALLLDFLKGAICVWLGRRFLLNDGFAALTGFIAMIGHSYPVFLNFRGGKSVATGAGAFLSLSPFALLASLVVFALIVAIFRIVSLGSIIGSGSFPIFAWLYGTSPQILLCGSLAAALIIFRHKANILRLRNGTERRLGEVRNA